MNRLFLRVVSCPVPVDKDNRRVAYNPSVVSGRQECHIPGTAIKFLTIRHDYMLLTRDLVLKMWSLTPLRLGNRFHMFRPTPTGFQD